MTGLGIRTENSLISPFSIQMALAMAYAGAAGDTRSEMTRVLHFPPAEGQLDGSFAALQAELRTVVEETRKRAGMARKYGGPSDSFTLTVADRLFGRIDYAFKEAYLTL